MSTEFTGQITELRQKGYVQAEALFKTAMAQLHTENRDLPHKTWQDTQQPEKTNIFLSSTLAVILS